MLPTGPFGGMRSLGRPADGRHPSVGWSPIGSLDGQGISGLMAPGFAFTATLLERGMARSTSEVLPARSSALTWTSTAAPSPTATQEADPWISSPYALGVDFVGGIGIQVSSGELRY